MGKENKIEKFCKKNQLKTNEQIRQFLKIRFTILSKSYEQHMKNSLFLAINASSSNNLVFAKRFIESEYNLVKSIIEFLN